MHWVVIEDAYEDSEFISELLTRLPFPSTHLVAKKTEEERRVGTRGCTQRNIGLRWILTEDIEDGVMYFADDDNAYDIRVFDELRQSTKIGLVPTGHLARTGLSSPIVRNGAVTGYLDVWPGKRKWPVEMASLGINIRFWRSRGAPQFTPTKKGFAETMFLEDMNVTYADLQPLAKNCTEFLVWHTNTKQVKVLKGAVTNKTAYGGSNIEELAKYLMFDPYAKDDQVWL